MQSSTKVLPYVYLLTHTSTGQFYIGYRCANKIPSSEDIFKYQTSSSYVKRIGFDQFNISIIAEFFNSEYAYEFEQALIYENFTNPLILNKTVCVDKQHFRLRDHSPETKLKMSASRIGIKKSPEMIAKMSASKTGVPRKHLFRKKSDNCRITFINKTITNFTVTSIQEFYDHLMTLRISGMSNTQISTHLTISLPSIGKYFKLMGEKSGRWNDYNTY